MLIQFFNPKLHPSFPNSSKPTAGYPLRKRTFDFIVPRRVSEIRTIDNPQAAVSKETEKTSSVPPNETVTSEKDTEFCNYWTAVRKSIFVDENPDTSNPVSSTLPPKIPASNPTYHKVSDEIWTKSDELLDRVLSNSSLTVTRVSTVFTLF